MPITKYKVGHWIFQEKGRAINHCIKNSFPFEAIHQYEQKTVAEVEAETGINYGCQPCTCLTTKECKGAKPGAFYYPSECPMFYNEHDEEKKIEAGW